MAHPHSPMTSTSPATARATTTANSEPQHSTNARLAAKTPACLPCRLRKIKCNGGQPTCSTCLAANRPCQYDQSGPKRRSPLSCLFPEGASTVPAQSLRRSTLAVRRPLELTASSSLCCFYRHRVEGSRRDRQDKKKRAVAAAAAALQIHAANPEPQQPRVRRQSSTAVEEDVPNVLRSAEDVPSSFHAAAAALQTQQANHLSRQGNIPAVERRPNVLHSAAMSRLARSQSSSSPEIWLPPLRGSHDSPYPSESCDTQSTNSADFDVSPHVILHGTGAVEVRGPTNTLYESLGSRQGLPRRGKIRRSDSADAYSAASYFLTRNAAEERGREVSYRQTLVERGYIHDVPAELALHLLDIHFNRHHFFCITYRPVFFRDMVHGGRFYSPLLLYALMAVTCRYSERTDPEVGGGDHAENSGERFYSKAEELLRDEVGKSSVPTATALLVMGNALMSAGQVDRGWDYTGRGIRMITQLGLYVEADRITADTPLETLEEIEVSRRLFWGAFVSEKLQSLYLGRPIFMHGRDCHVPKKFMDVYEEDEIWRPFLVMPGAPPLPHMTTNGVTNFIHHCVLSEICEDIMSSFYQVHAKRTPRHELRLVLDRIRGRLRGWNQDLPDKLKFTPWDERQTGLVGLVPMHTMVLHTIYLSLVILSERPFVANGHLKGNDHDGSWHDCTVAAERIACLLSVYRYAYSFRRVPYQLCYATYVASTILVRNATGPGTSGAHAPSMEYLGVCLLGFREMKLAHPGTQCMEDRIQKLMDRLNINSVAWLQHQPHPFLRASVALPVALPSQAQEYDEATQAVGELSHPSLPFAAGPSYTPGLSSSMPPVLPQNGDYSLMSPHMAGGPPGAYLVPQPPMVGSSAFATDSFYYMPMQGINDDTLYGPLRGNWG